MDEIIQKVLAAEQQAREMVAAARVAAESQLTAARQQADAIKKESAARAEAEAQQRVAATVEQANQKQHDLLTRAEAELRRQVRLDETLRREAVAAVIRCVCGQSRQEGG